MTEQPWRRVLGGWWPWLLPGSAASATHGIIRVGHAVRALLADGENPVHAAELAHGLAHWAARWQPYPRADGQPAPAPDQTPAAALATVPRLGDQSGGFRARFAPGAIDEVFARAVTHGGEHAIKFADTAADVYGRTGNPAAIAAAVRAVELIPRPH